jgi:hypothetical protein
VNHTQAYIYKISDSFKNSTVLISGHQVVGQDMDLPGNIMLLNKLQDLIEFTEVNSKT